MLWRAGKTISRTNICLGVFWLYSVFPRLVWISPKPADVNLVTPVRNDSAVMAVTLQRTMIITARKLLNYNLLLRSSLDRGLVRIFLDLPNFIVDICAMILTECYYL